MASPTFFPRGPGPLVSVLIPTRGRPDDLRGAIRSAYALAWDKSNLEFLLKVDDDDEETYKAAQELSKELKCRFVIQVYERGLGYADIHKFVNGLCEEAEGDWLFLYNDNARMITPKWDEIIKNISAFNKPIGIQDVALLVFQQDGDLGSYSFCALRKEAYQILGHFSQYLHCDLYQFQLMNAVDSIIKIPVTIKHLQERESDNTGKQSIASACDLWRTMKIPGAIKYRLRMANELVYHIEAIRLISQWTDRPKDGTGWYWWRKDSKDCERPMVVCDTESYPVVAGSAWMIGSGGAIGPSPGSDREVAVYEIDKIGGEWSPIK